jgi:fatty-acyl-CoA synthase
MMDFPLTLSGILRRAETLFPGREVVSRAGDAAARRVGYGELARRARRIGAAIAGLGVGAGDRVGTLCMNHQEHLELYFGLPAVGAILHTLNPRLPAEDLAYIAGHAGDRVLVVDEPLLPVLDAIRERVGVEHVVVVGAARGGDLAYADLLAAAPDDPSPGPDPDERTAAVLCYTSGTTGRPKGVLYSHRALALHSLGCALPDVLDLGEADTLMAVVPMFHVNAWGLPFTCAMVGAGQVLPGRWLDPHSLLSAMEEERVTLAAGVPTVWLAVLDALDGEPGRYDTSRLRQLIVGGATPPPALIRSLGDRHGIEVLHAWGMTEMSPVGTVSRLASDLAEAPPEERLRLRAKQGRPAPFVEIRARAEEGLVPWDGATLGELEVRGPWVAAEYFDADGADRFTDDGWFRTGDVVTVDERGYVEIADREKDLVKSGGEWISSVALESALMDHPAVAEAAVVGVPHPRWQERPLACVVLRDGHSATPQELVAHLSARFPSWWLPERVEYIEAVPRTATGKFKKSELRERYRDILSR